MLLPGLVDTHVHVNEPGRTEWEGVRHRHPGRGRRGSDDDRRHAAEQHPADGRRRGAGGEAQGAEPQAYVDVGFWGGAIPGNSGELRGLHDAGVFGFKCFLLHSGVDEFPHLEPDELEADLHLLRSFGALMIVHAEDSTAIDRAPSAHGESYATYLASRPRGAENVAIAHVIEAARWTGARVHILHLSSSDAIPMIRSARRDGVQISVETCPHYLFFTAEEVLDGSTQYKCCPPIREADNRELLWRGLADGDIDCIVSDHSPCTPELKRLDIGDFGVAWGGIAGLQVGPLRRLDRGTPPRVLAVRRGPLDGGTAGSPGWAQPQGACRTGVRRRLRRLRAG